MSTELEILKDKSLAVFGDHKPPRNKGQRKLLDYINTCMGLNQQIDDEETFKIYIKNVKNSKGYWATSRDTQKYRTHEEASKYYKEVVAGYGCEVFKDGVRAYDHHQLYWTSGIFHIWALSQWDTKQGYRSWFQRALGSLVKTGHLIVIPKGYVLKKIEENGKG